MKITTIPVVILTALVALVVATTLIASYRLHVYFPATDLQTNAGFLLHAASVGLDWNVLTIHNGMHWIVFPKVIFSLDMYFFQGTGWLTMLVSWICILICALIFLSKLVKESSINLTEKWLLSSLILGLFFGAWMLEATNNQINLQWTALMMAVSLLAASLDNYLKQKSLIFLLAVFLSVTLLLMCAGQPVALLVAILTVYVFSLGTVVKLISVLFLVVFLLIEGFVFLFNSADLPNLLSAYITSDNPVWGVIKTVAELGLVKRWFLFFGDVLLFLAKFLWPMFHDLMTVKFLVPATTILLALVLFRWINLRAVGQGKFWLFCVVFCLTTAVLAAIIRTSNGYTIRFSSLGVMALVSAIIYFRINSNSYQRFFANVLAGLIIAVLPYVSLLAIDNYMNSASASGTSKSQLAYSLEIQQSKLIVNRPGAWWQETDAEQIREFVPKWKAMNIGIFGSSDYQTYQSQESLPSNQTYCQYSIEKINYHHFDDEIVVYLTGYTTSEFDIFSKIIFYQNNVAVGWGKRRLHGSWQDVLLKPANWEGFVKLPRSSSAPIEVMAYTDDIRCNKYLVDINK